MRHNSIFDALTLVAAWQLVQGVIAIGPAIAIDPKVSETKEGKFAYLPEWGSIQIKTVKDSPLLDPDDKPDGIAPAHIECTFTKSKATIYVYPIESASSPAFQKRYKVVVDALRDLRKTLKDHPAAPATMPMLPWMDMEAAIISKAHYESGKDRSSVRFITQLNGEPAEINNTDLVYSAQALTADGKSYISVYFPVTAEGLPAKNSVDQMKADHLKKFTQDYSNYTKSVEKRLNALGDAAFKPALSIMDKLVDDIQSQYSHAIKP